MQPIKNLSIKPPCGVWYDGINWIARRRAICDFMAHISFRVIGPSRSERRARGEQVASDLLQLIGKNAQMTPCGRAIGQCVNGAMVSSWNHTHTHTHRAHSHKWFGRFMGQKFFMTIVNMYAQHKQYLILLVLFLIAAAVLFRCVALHLRHSRLFRYAFRLIGHLKALFVFDFKAG